MNTNHLEIISESVKPTKNPATRKTITNFSEQKVELGQAPLFFPPGYEYIFLAIYFLTLPYLVGLLFVFFYIAHANFELFSSINEKSSYLFSWAIGYEVLAAIFFIFIIKLFIDSARAERSRSKLQQKFQRPY